MMKQALHRKLRSLWLGELVATIVFVMAYFSIRANTGAAFLGNYSLLALIILCIILLEGSAYWWLKLRQVSTGKSIVQPRFIQIVFIINILLLLVYPAALLIAILNGSIEDVLADAVIGGGIYLFALAEFVHYFIVKLVRSEDDQRARTRRRQVTSRLMRELQRGEARKENL